VELQKGRICLCLKLKVSNEISTSVHADIPVEVKRRGVEMRMIFGEYKGKPDASLLKAVARARLWFEELATGKVATIAEIARREKIDKGYIGRLLKLAFLPPSAVDSIVAGTQPAEWTVNGLLSATAMLTPAFGSRDTLPQ
jgi:hypothetical protein